MFINAIALVRVLAKNGYVQEGQAKRERLGGSISEVMTVEEELRRMINWIEGRSASRRGLLEWGTSCVHPL